MTVTRIATACLAAATLTACETKPTEWFRVEPLSVRQADLDGSDKEKQVARTEGAPASVNLDVFALEVPSPQTTPQPQSGAQAQTTTRNATGSSSTQAATQQPYKIRLTQVSQPAERDAWIAFLIERSNQQCDYHKAGIVATQSIVNGAAGATAGILGGVGALVTGATAARIFSGSAGMVTGLRAQYNEVFYQNLISTAVVRKIDEMRNTKYASIKSQLGKEMKEYSVPRALLDIGEYHNACSFYAGLVALTDEKQRLKPLGDSLQLQIAATRENIKATLGNIETATKKMNETTGTPAEAVHKNYIDQQSRSLQDQEMHLRSLQNQLSIVGASTGKPEDGKEVDKTKTDDPKGANGANGTNPAKPGDEKTNPSPRGGVTTEPVTPAKEP